MGFRTLISASRRAGLLLFLSASLALAQGPPSQHQPAVGYVPTSDLAVRAMLRLAGEKPSDVVYDLGCGDGRIVITAAKEYGAHGVGIDIDPRLIEQAKENAKSAGVENLVRFEVSDLFQANIHDASVVALFLLSSLNLKLRPKLLQELEPGTRIVSNTFDMGDWKPTKHVTVKASGKDRFFSRNLYLWVIPRPSAK